MMKLRIVWFWVVAFYTIIRETMRGNEWNMIYADFHCGNEADGIRTKRKQLIAKKTCSGFDIYWQKLPTFEDLANDIKDTDA